ncbi:MAG: hemolysin family protein [Ruthenibacterium sp.]
MENQLVWQLLLQAALIALNAVFACAEIAVISFNDAKLAHMAAQGDKRAVALARLTSQPARFLATIQVAITLSGFLGSAFAASNFSFRLMQLAQEWNLPVSAATVETVSVILITLLLSYVTLVLGELVPKRIAMKKAETLALGMAGFISAISVLFKPLVSLLTASTNGILRLVGIDPNSEENEVTEEEIRMMVDVGTEKGTIASDEKEMIQNVFELNDLTVDEIATHRTDAAFLDDADTPEEWARFINSTRYSLYPICRGGLDNVVGVLNTKDYFRLADKSRAAILHGAVSKPVFVPEGLRVDVLFRRMQSSHNHFAVVVDEYGGVSGIVTMHDLVEQLVGEIEDEKESLQHTQELTQLDEHTWRAVGSVLLTDLNAALGTHLYSEDYDTLNGVVFDSYGSIPPDNTHIEVDLGRLHVEVREIKEHVIENALLTVQEKTPSAAQA